MLGSIILYLKGMRIMMFQLSGFCYKSYGLTNTLEAIPGAIRESPVQNHPKPSTFNFRVSPYPFCGRRKSRSNALHLKGNVRDTGSSSYADLTEVKMRFATHCPLCNS